MVREIQRVRRRTACRDENGFTMVEMIIAMFIFAIVIVGVAVGMSSSLNVTRQNRNRSIAANLAAQEMDTVRSMKFTDLEAEVGQVLVVQSVDSVPYTITRETQWVTPNATSGPCQAPSGSTLAYLAVDVSVSWNNMAGVRPPASHTVITPPVGTYNPVSGHIAVTVLDRAGLPQDGVTVTLTGAGPPEPPQDTTTDGCAFFAFQPAGSYTVAISEPGFVDGQGVPAPSQSATVQVGSKVSAQFQYDAASTLSLSLQGNTGSAPPSAVPVTLGHTQILPAGTKTFTGSGSPRTIAGQFPYLAGYEAWVGSCLDADPEGIDPFTSAAFYPGASRATPIATTPGATSSAVVLMPELLVHAETSTGTPRQVSVVVTHTADGGCPSGASYTLGTTNASGNLTAALPYGTWSITAGSTSGGSVTLSPLNPPTPTVRTVIVP
jgi:prepilin-type N-terminal cleavage/methylation domain-containing protein